MFGLPFLEKPEVRAARVERARSHFEPVLVPKAEPWDLYKIKVPRRKREERCFSGFNFGSFVPSEVGLSPSGRFRRQDIEVPRGTMMPYPLRQPESMWSDPCEARIFFTEDAALPALHEARHDGWRTWMGLSVAEMLTQRSGIQFCRGDVVIGGLGLGWFLHEVRQRSCVKRIIVVEKERELLDWYGDEMCQRYNAEVICGDVWEEMPKLGKAFRYALDIWPSFFDARWDRNLQRVRRGGYNCWAWGSARSAEE